MKTTVEGGIVLACLAIFWIPSQGAAQPEIPIGVVLEIKSPAYLRLTDGAAPLQLDPKRDVMRKLYAGQSLRVGPRGHLKLGLNTGIKEIRPSETWFVVKQEPSLTPEQTKVAQALRRYGTAGGMRSIGSTLLSPVEGSAVRAKRMVIRWNPPKKEAKIDFRIETEGGKQLWGIKGVDATAARLDSKAINKALAHYQSTGGQEGLVLVMTNADANETRVIFFLLSKQSEQDLQRELNRWDRVGDPLLCAIGRAYEYGRRMLLVESAEEYEAALALAPESQDLILSAIEAHRRAGDFSRVGQLRERLSKIE